MGEFKLVLKKRIMLLSLFTVMAMIFIATAGVWGYKQSVTSSHIQGFMYGTQAGMATGFLAIMLGLIIKYAIALKKDDKIKAIYIEENDERKKLIRDKIGGAGYDFIIGVMMVAIIIAGFFNELVFITLFGTLAFMALVKFSLKVYYNRKY